MRFSFKRIVPILLALAMCGCSSNTASDSDVNSTASFESVPAANESESVPYESGVSSETAANNSTGINESSKENDDSESKSNSFFTTSSNESTVSENSSNSDGSDIIIENEIGLSPKAFPDKLEEIPRGYFDTAQEQGTLVDLNYTTYESFSYVEKTQTLQKRAVVYLPYGYDENQKYNVFYLMHGGWSNETTTLGTHGNPSSMKNVLDNAIADGKIPPLIVVCPTYNNTSGEDSASYSLALQLTRNYHNELINDLIPAVEGKYSSYAASTSAEDLIAARDHRGFGGFSMGSVTTWRTFEYCLDYFRYFAPSSGSLITDGGYMDDIVKNSGYDWNDFFLVTMTGTEDFAASAFEQQIENMQNYDSFRYSDTEKDGNLTFRIKEGYSHSGTAAMEYTYNALRWFWNTNP